MKKVLSLLLCVLALCAVNVTAMAGGPTTASATIDCNSYYQNIDIMYLPDANSVEVVAQTVPGCTVSYSTGIVYLSGSCYLPGTYTVEMEVKRGGGFEEAVCTVYARPSDPIVNGISGGGTYTVGEACTLWADFFTNGDSCDIIWYSTSSNDISTIMAVTDGTNCYTVPQTVGTRYYCVGVIDHWNNGESSNIVYSPLTSVTYKEKPAPAPVTPASETAAPETRTSASPSPSPSPSASPSPSPSPNRRTDTGSTKHAAESPSSTAGKGGKTGTAASDPSPSAAAVTAPALPRKAGIDTTVIVLLAAGGVIVLGGIVAAIVILTKKKK